MEFVFFAVSMAAWYRGTLLSILLLSYCIHCDEEEESEEPEFISTCNSDSIVRPNIVFILLDDLGWGDLSGTTGQFPTPNMDSLYKFNSVQLTRHYVHLMDSPSRTQFLTGRYAMNLGFGEFDAWEDSVIGGIPIGQPTVANWLSQFGEYTTYGVGKWHLGTFQ